MTQPTVNQVHQDAPLTTLSIAYMQSQDQFVADKVFPILPVAKQSDTYYTYDQGPWWRDGMQRRTAGGHYAETGWTLATDSYRCDQWALAHPIADEERDNADDVLDLDQDAAEFLALQALIRRERALASDFMATGVWTTDNTGATDWDASGGVPITNVQVAARTIMQSIGKPPNVAVMGLITFQALQTNAQIVALVQYSQRALPADLGEGVIATALGLDRLLVGRASYESAAEGATSSILPILDDDCLIAYVPDRVARKVITAGLTFVWAKESGGGMGTLTRVRSDERDADIARIKMNFDQKKVAAGAGYFFSDIV